MTIPVKHYQLRTILNHSSELLKKLEPILQSFLEQSSIEPEPESEAIGPAAIVSPQDPNPRQGQDAKYSRSPPTPTGSASYSIFCLLAFGNKKTSSHRGL